MPRALIAEDDYANAVLVRDYCKDMDFEPELAVDRRAVVEAVRSCPPDMILLGIDKGAADGLAATVQTRSLENVSEQMMIIGLNSDQQGLSAACQRACWRRV